MASIGQVVTDIYRRRRVRVLEHSKKIGIAGAHPGSFDLRYPLHLDTDKALHMSTMGILLVDNRRHFHYEATVSCLVTNDAYVGKNNTGVIFQ